MKATSKIISYAFHPLLIPTWFVLLMYYTHPYAFAGSSVVLSIANVVFQTFLMPFIAILLLIKLDLVNTIEIDDQKQRIIPLIITIIFYIWFYKVSRTLQYPKIVSVFMLGAVIALFISFFINVFHKLSLHMIAVSGMLTIILLLIFISITDMSNYFLIAVILCGAVATARLYLNAHTMREVYTGFMVGMFSQILGLLLFDIL